MSESNDYQLTIDGYNDVIERLASLVVTAKIYPKVFESEEHQEYHVYFDRILYVIHCQIDLVIALKHLFSHLGKFPIIEIQYFARLVALTSWEVVSNTNKIWTKEMRNYVRDRMQPEDMEKIQGHIKELNLIKEKEGTTLKDIRDKTIGHKHFNAVELDNMIKAISPIDIYRIGSDIFRIQLKLSGALSSALKFEKEE